MTDDGLSIDELAELTGVPARTIRFYRQSGLIEPPERRGRRAYYDRSQLERLRTIAELRGRGLGLDAIAAVLDDRDGAGQSLAEVLLVGDELRQRWADDRELTMTRLEIQERIGTDAELALALLEHYDVIAPVGGRPDRYHVPSVATLDLTADLAAAGVTPDQAHAAWLAMRARLRELAHDLIGIFVAADEAGGDGSLERLRTGFETLRPLALRAVQLSFAHEMAEALEEFVASGGVLHLGRGAAGPDDEARPGPGVSPPGRS